MEMMKKLFAMVVVAAMLCCAAAASAENGAPVEEPLFSFSHFGINGDNAEEQAKLRDFIENALLFHDTREIAVSYYTADDNVELLKDGSNAKHGHFGIYTTDLPKAIAYLQGLGYELDYDTAKYEADNTTMRLIYLKDQFNGFIVHLTTSIKAKKESAAEEPLFAFDHIGVNGGDAEEQTKLLNFIQNDLQFNDTVDIGASNYVANFNLELLKAAGSGEHGHIAFYTSDLPKAISHLEGLGYEMDYDTAKYQDDNKTMRLVYLKDQFNGFTIHLTTTKRR